MKEINIEKKIRHFLKLKNMSIKELCKSIGMSQQNLDRIFKANSINTNHLQKMAEVLDVEMSYFFLSEEEIEALTQEVDSERIDELRKLNKLTKQNILKSITNNFLHFEDFHVNGTFILILYELSNDELIDVGLDEIKSVARRHINHKVIGLNPYESVVAKSVDSLRVWIFEQAKKELGIDAQNYDEYLNSLENIEDIASPPIITISEKYIGKIPKKLITDIAEAEHQFAKWNNKTLKLFVSKDSLFKKLSDYNLLEHLKLDEDQKDIKKNLIDYIF